MVESHYDLTKYSQTSYDDYRVADLAEAAVAVVADSLTPCFQKKGGYPIPMTKSKKTVIYSAETQYSWNALQKSWSNERTVNTQKTLNIDNSSFWWEETTKFGSLNY